MDKQITYNKEFNEIYKQRINQYFKRYFLNKNINEAIFDVIKDGTIKLSGVYIDFCMICNCLEIIIDNKMIPKEDKKLVNEVLMGVTEIKSDIENIVTQIAEGLDN